MSRIHEHDDLFTARQVYLWCFRGVIFYSLIAAMLWALSGCSGGGGSGSGVVSTQPSSGPGDPGPKAVTCPVGSQVTTAPTLADCSPGANSGAQNQPAPPPPPPTPPPTCSPGSLSYPCTQPPTNGSTGTTPPGSPPVIVLKANPMQLQVGGGTVVITWDATGASYCDWTTGFLPSVENSQHFAVTGAIGLTVTATTLFTLECAGGPFAAPATVTVAVASPPVCTPPAILLNGTTCYTPPVFGPVTLQPLSPPSVSDNSLGCPDPGGNACTSTVSWTVTADPADKYNCYLNGSTQAADNPTSLGPYPAAQDGTPAPVSLYCKDDYGQVVQAQPTTLGVHAPTGPPADTFQCTRQLNSDPNNTYWFDACTWTVNAPGAECSVLDGNTGAMVPGGSSGGPTGKVWTGSAQSPDMFTLQCNVPTTANPEVTL